MFPQSHIPPKTMAGSWDLPNQLIFKLLAKQQKVAHFPTSCGVIQQVSRGSIARNVPAQSAINAELLLSSGQQLCKDINTLVKAAWAS